MKTCRTSTLSLTASIVAGMAITLSAQTASAQINEAFDTVGTTNPPTGWTTTNHSTTIGSTGWFNGNSTVFPSQAGAGYIGANFNNTTGTNTISNWLISPQSTMQAGKTIKFWTRSVTASNYPDRLQVRISLNGGSTNVGTSSTDVGDFTTLVQDINPTYLTVNSGGYPQVWTEFTIVLTAGQVPSPTQGRIALRYFVESGGPTGANSDYIGVDTFSYDGTTNDCLIALPAGCQADVSSTTAGVPDNKVDVSDLVFIITNWGANGPPRPAADISSTSGLGNPDCTVDVSDLLAVITSWGDCQGACCTLGNCSTTSAPLCALGGGTYQGNGVLCANVVCPQPPPVNDECINAITASNGANAFNNSAATTSAGAACATIGKDLWYNYVATNTTATINTCTTVTWDSIIQVFDGCGGAEIGCNDDFCSLQSSVSLTGLTVGNTYKIRIGVFGTGVGGSGSFTIVAP